MNDEINSGGLKDDLRRKARQVRSALHDRAARSRRIVERATRLVDLSKAPCVAAFAGVRSEVETLPYLFQRLERQTRLLLPVCQGTELELWEFRDLQELEAGAFGVPELRPELRTEMDRRYEPEDVPLFLVPGLAFDRRGSRLGQGGGHFDRLLARRSAGATLVGLAFHCQLWSEIPTEDHDVAMDLVVTEEEVVDCRALSPGPPAAPDPDQ